MDLYQCHHCQNKFTDEEIYDSIEDTWFICYDCYLYHSEEWDYNKEQYD